MATRAVRSRVALAQQERDKAYASSTPSTHDPISTTTDTVASTTRSIRDPAQGVYEYLEERHDWTTTTTTTATSVLFPMSLSGWMLRREGILFAKRYKRRFCVFDATTNELALYANDDTSVVSGRLLRKLVITSVDMTTTCAVGDLEVTGYERRKEIGKKDSDRIARRRRRRTSSGSDRRGDQQRFYRPQYEQLRTVSGKSATVWSHCFHHHMKSYKQRQRLQRLAELEAMVAQWDPVEDEELFEEDEQDDADEDEIEPEFVFRETYVDQEPNQRSRYERLDPRLVFDHESSVRITKNGDLTFLGARAATSTTPREPRDSRRTTGTPLLRCESTESCPDPLFVLSSSSSLGLNSGGGCSGASIGGALLIQSSSSIWEDADLLAYRVDYDAIQRTRLLSSGSFGDVWLAQYRATQTIAVKTLKPTQDRTRRDEIRSFLDEIRLLSLLQHGRIVAFLGVAWTMESDVQLLMEFMPRGDLRTYLATLSSQQNHAPSGNETKDAMVVAASPWTRQQWRMAVDIIEGLVYLHSLRDPLVHGDLKSRNLLLDANLRVSIADFGLARFVTSDGLNGDRPRRSTTDFSTGTSTGTGTSDSSSTASVGSQQIRATRSSVLQGTGRWLAPELLAGAASRRDWTPAVDLYSFGVVLSEIDTLQIPFHDRVLLRNRGDNGTREAISEQVLLHHIVVDAWAPTFSMSCPVAVLAIARQCLAADPQRRPSSLDAAHRLRKAMANTLATTGVV